MKKLLQLEEASMFVAGLYLFSLLSYPWWMFPLLLLTPDIGMIGYLFNPKIGACIYNFFHSRITAIIAILIGSYYHLEVVMLVGIIFFSHAAMDRMFHYGLKHADSFKHTHLGNLS